MNRYKKFALSIVLILFGFFLYNIAIWKLFTEELMTGKGTIPGDLTRMGYILGSKQPRKNIDDLPRRHFEQEEYTGQHVDILTIGDSFTNGGGGGKNRYYQDYIASINDMSVMNIEPFNEQSITILQLAFAYLNNGYLDTVKPKALIISLSEKFCIKKLSNSLDPDISISLESLNKKSRMGYRANVTDVSPEEPLIKFGFINDGNFKFPLYSLYYFINDHAFFSKTYKFSIDKPLFNAKNRNTLLVYREDLRNLPKSTTPAIEKLNDNLNLLADRLAAKGIKLYFMPCVDKYNLYSDFIIKNRYPRSTFFENLRPLPKRYTFIDTKAILYPEVKSGTKDIFHADDTHWSWRASEKIFTSIKFR